MKSNYKRLGDYIQTVKEKNSDLKASKLLGINIDKFFMPSVANVVGTDMRNYKIVKTGQFACNRMHVGRDYRIPIALSNEEIPFMVSPAYDVFEIIDTAVLLPEYLMMWFSRKEFDRNTWFHTDADVRGGLPWSAFCDLELPIPSIEKQQEIVKEFNIIKNRIAINNQLISKLEETAQAIFNNIVGSDNTLNEYRLGDLIEIKGGFSYNSNDIGKGNSYLLGMGCVSFTERFLESGMRLYSDNIPETHIVTSKDIIIATRQQSENMPILGFPAMIPPNLRDKRLVIASNLYRVVNNSTLSNEFIFQVLKSEKYQNRIKEQSKGTTVGMITKDAIEDYKFEAPNLEILNSSQVKIDKIIDMIFIKLEENQKLVELKELLLTKMTRVN